MTRHVIGDHHFSHLNIIDYTDRPFDSVNEMNTYMLARWEQVVSDDDPVLHMGDVVFTNENKTAEDYLSELPGNPTLLLGNHDDQINPENFRFLCMEQTVIQHYGYRFYCTHRPENVPSDWTEWVIHGHVHNDQPFIDYNNNKINVSVEQVGYTPIPVPIIVKALKNMNSGDVARTITDSPITDFQWYQDYF